jgi:hypothetical protein
MGTDYATRWLLRLQGTASSPRGESSFASSKISAALARCARTLKLPFVTDYAWPRSHAVSFWRLTLSAADERVRSGTCECARSGSQECSVRVEGATGAGLIKGKLGTVWQADCSKKPPTLIGDIPGHFDSLASQLGEGGLDVVAHEIELVMALAVSWMSRKLGRGRAQISQPPPASAEGRPSTSAKNARTFSAYGENTIACVPVITP